jgi:hypothetical protein
MKIQMTTKRCFARLLCAGLLLVTSSCGKKDSEDEGPSGTLRFAMKTTGKPSTALSLASAATDFRNTSIASGAPTSLKIYLTKMSLKGDSGEKTIFYDGAGKAINIGSSTVDISNLFTNYACVDSSGVPVDGIKECPCGLDNEKKAIAKNAEGTCPDSGNGAVGSAQVGVGTFTTLRAEFSVRAKVKGCVTGNFGTIGSNGAGTQGSRTYCTKASAHTFQATPGVAAASELPTTLATAEEMDYQLTKANELYTDTTRTSFIEFPIKGGVKIEETTATPPTLTLMIDTNRMLRFYNMNITQSPNPGMSSSRAYFFNTVFEESTFVFAGQPGAIRGFQWWTDACQNNTTGATCTGSTTVVAGWMTIIKDSASAPLVVGLMPDDDNTATIIKGSNKSSAGIDQGAFTASGTNYDIAYALGELKGTLKAIDVDSTVGTTQTKSFIGFQNYGGALYLKRGL